MVSKALDVASRVQSQLCSVRQENQKFKSGLGYTVSLPAVRPLWGDFHNTKRKSNSMITSGS